MKDCIFCKIIKGEVPSYKVYEDDFVYAFLDIKPSAKGHTLVIPKKHSENIFDIEKEDLEKTINASRKISQKMKEIGCDGINIYNNNGESAGQIVFHFHIHIVPRNINLKGKSFEEIIDKLKID